MKPPIQSKSRLDIVDTTLLKQQEKKVLKGLLVLLSLTLLYEYAPATSFFGETAPEAEIQQTTPPNRRVFPLKKVEHLTSVLASVSLDLPIAREYLASAQTRLNSLSKEATKNPDPAKIRTTVIPLLQELSRFCQLPTWSEPSLLAPLQKETQDILTLLGEPIPAISFTPRLEFGPRLLSETALPRRNLFEYPQSPVGETASEERSIGAASEGMPVGKGK